MKKYICIPCGYIYDPAIGDPDEGVDPGTEFQDLPEDWLCPVCGEETDKFAVIEESLATLVSGLHLTRYLFFWLC